MSDRPRIHVLFTMDCLPARNRTDRPGPNSWEQSARSIDAFCTRLLDAGYPATLFITPTCGHEHGPLLDAFKRSGVELGLLVQPQNLRASSFNRYLGQYGRDDQLAIVDLAVEQFHEALGYRPQSVRSAMFSASNDTYSVLFERGFRQGSMSNPGRRITKHGAMWTGAVADPHYVDVEDRLCAGELPFFEVPVTADASQVRGGLSSDLAIENGTVDAWHVPLIQGQLNRMRSESVPFRALCLHTSNTFGFHRADVPHSATLDGLIRVLATLEDAYEIMPVTLAGAHARFRDEQR